MTRTTDQPYLRSQQYKNSLNLEARIQLHQRFSAATNGLHHQAELHALIREIDPAADQDRHAAE